MTEMAQNDIQNESEKFVSLLITLPVFKDFTRNELRLAIKYMNHRHAQIGEFIFYEGEKEK